MTEQAPQDLVDRLRAVGCVFAEDEARLLVEVARSPADLAALVERRAGGEPLEQVLGWTEFFGTRMVLEPGVFVPRRRSELLVHQTLAVSGAGALVVDLCCGSGAVGAAVAMSADSIELHAADVDPVAVQCARRNVDPVGGRVHEGDLFVPLPVVLRGQVDVVVANAPYVPTAAVRLMPPEARIHEPMVALDGGADGLDVQRRLVAEAPGWLRAGGHLLVETSAAQEHATLEVFTRSGFETSVARSEELDGTVVVGRLGRR